MRTRRLLVAIILVGALGAGAYWVLSYNPRTFVGSGAMVGTGFFSFRRYQAPLGEFPLHEAGEHEFTFSGLPNERMVLMLYVPGFSSGQRGELDELHTQILARISDSQGNTVCEGRGTPRGSEPDRWELMSSQDGAAFWHPQCNRIQFERGQGYTLHISVAEVDPNSPAASLHAVLEGGGVE